MEFGTLSTLRWLTAPHHGAKKDRHDDPAGTCDRESHQPRLLYLGHGNAGRLNFKPITLRELPSALRSVLSWHAVPVVYLEGAGCLEVDEVVRVMDVVRGAWYGVSIVLLTPGLKNVARR
jgi:biopolymer transport protein ExbD